MSEIGASQTAALAPSSSSTKRLSTINKPPGDISPNKASGGSLATGNSAGGNGLKDVVTPGELCGFVDNLLAQLETRFDEMSEQVLGRMNEMSSRIDTLESVIQDLMHGGIDAPSPSTPTPNANPVGAGGGKR